MLPDLLEKLVGPWSDSLHETVHLKEPLSTILIRGAYVEDRKINILVFNHGENAPVLTMKVVRSAIRGDQIVHEYDSLQTLWKIPFLQDSIPRPLGLFETSDRFVYLEKSLPGTTLANLIRRRKRLKEKSARADLFRLQDWLQLFQQGTAGRVEKFPGTAAVDIRLERLHRFQLDLPPPFVDILMSLAAEYTDAPVQYCGSHRDFAPGNVLIDGERIGIIDWEDYATNESPFNDLFFFMSMYAFEYPWKAPSAKPQWTRFRCAYLGDNWLSRIIEGCAAAHCASLELPPESARLFFPLFLMDMSAPREDSSLQMQKKSKDWQEKLMSYAENEKHSIFAQ